MRLIDVRRHEIASLAWAAGWFFCVLAGYYAIRPVREAYAVDAGPQGVSRLFGIVFLVMLAATPVYGLIAGRLPKAWLPPVIYGFFALNLVAFRLAFAGADAGLVLSLQWAFYVWVGVFNMFTVTLFWSTAVELFEDDQAQRLFGPLAGAGTLGGIAGSQIASRLPQMWGLSVESLLWIPCLFLALAIVCAAKLRSAVGPRGLAVAAPRQDAAAPAAAWRESLTGVAQTFRSPYLTGIALSVVLVSVCATVIYNLMLDTVADQIVEPRQRVSWFANLNASQNLLTFVGQTALASWLIRKLGVGWSLAIIPGAFAAGFAAFAWHSSLAMIGALDVVQRVLGFAIGVPAREVLFTLVTQDEKYRAKAFIDTVGKRGGDALSSYGYAAVVASGWGASMLAASMLPLTMALAALNLTLGRMHEQRKPRYEPTACGTR